MKYWKMKAIKICFDVDGTLIDTGYNDLYDLCEENIHKRIVELLKIMSSFKNVKIIVWSWQWKEWAQWVVEVIWIEKYVDWYASKNYKGKDENWIHLFEPDLIPDIAIDDIQACELWLLNLIVKEK